MAGPGHHRPPGRDDPY